MLVVVKVVVEVKAIKIFKIKETVINYHIYNSEATQKIYGIVSFLNSIHVTPQKNYNTNKMMQRNMKLLSLKNKIERRGGKKKIILK